STSMTPIVHAPPAGVWCISGLLFSLDSDISIEDLRVNATIYSGNLSGAEFWHIVELESIVHLSNNEDQNSTLLMAFSDTWGHPFLELSDYQFSSSMEGSYSDFEVVPFEGVTGPEDLPGSIGSRFPVDPYNLQPFNLTVFNITVDSLSTAAFRFSSYYAITATVNIFEYQYCIDVERFSRDSTHVIIGLESNDVTLFHDYSLFPAEHLEITEIGNARRGTWTFRGNPGAMTHASPSAYYLPFEICTRLQLIQTPYLPPDGTDSTMTTTQTTTDTQLPPDSFPIEAALIVAGCVVLAAIFVTASRMSQIVILDE
ncbi:MAG: hypothetical protein ACXABY_13775, partial [Candidatus Thorarchaeota archaeon]